MENYPDSVIYSHYNAESHTSEQSLRQQFGCPYPRADAERGIGISSTFRNHTADLQPALESCCVPDTDCQDCRHYAAGSAIVSSRLEQHVSSEEKFRGWLDYVDTYLAIWVVGYERDENLYQPSNLVGT